MLEVEVEGVKRPRARRSDKSGNTDDPEPYAFDPTRFSRTEDHNARSLQYVTTTTEFIPFGHGKHACPGRFFASADLKVLLTHIVLNYDVKLVGNGPRPKNVFWGTNVDPPRDVELMFRKRRLN